jgi:DNA-3-methyladenine glycosylase
MSTRLDDWLGDGEGFGDFSVSEAQLPRSFFARPVLEVARELIGSTVLVDGIGGLIVETEAYSHEDPASHSFRGRTARNASMFGPPGHAYVYLSYGMHWCMNFVCGRDPLGSGVLIRAIEPIAGLSAMRARRGVEDPRLLCSGPGRLCQALAVTRKEDGAPLDEAPFRLLRRLREPEILVGPRIGITQAPDKPWRFGLAGSAFVSRPFRSAPSPGGAS